MNIAIDIRPLQSPVRTGVGEYAYELLSAVFLLYPEHSYYLCSSGLQSFNLPEHWRKSNIIPLHVRLPNKLINVGILFGHWPSLSVWPKLLRKNIIFDAIYYPNLNFIAPEQKVRTILTIHDLSFFLFPEYFSVHRRLWHRAVRAKKIANAVSHLTVPSESAKNDLAESFKINREKISVLPPGQCSDWQEPGAADVLRVRTKYNLPAKFVLCLATIEPRKNIKAAILGFGEWQQKNNVDADLIIAGAPGWKNKEIFSLIKTTPRVRFIGYVADADKPALYKLARVFLYPSFYEGFGLPILEAMRSSVPVIASNCSALPESAGAAAYAVDPDRYSDIAAGLNLLWEDENLRIHYLELGRKQVQKFSWEETAREFMNIVENKKAA